ncbi:hypothetical protein ACIOTN_00295 [Glutamicibacter sp. NPDC087661]|uniref:hypothetical protein n=1 Tax=Glutamicibacter sp. NPDC087661 TaxID=3363996 RepID=UPI00381C5A2E
MSRTFLSKIRILTALSIAMMALSFVMAHSWLLQILTLGLGASALIGLRPYMPNKAHKCRQPVTSASLARHHRGRCIHLPVLHLVGDIQACKVRRLHARERCTDHEWNCIEHTILPVAIHGIDRALADRVLRPADGIFSWKEHHKPGEYRQLGRVLIFGASGFPGEF